VLSERRSAPTALCIQKGSNDQSLRLIMLCRIVYIVQASRAALQVYKPSGNEPHVGIWDIELLIWEALSTRINTTCQGCGQGCGQDPDRRTNHLTIENSSSYCSCHIGSSLASHVLCSPRRLRFNLGQPSPNFCAAMVSWSKHPQNVFLSEASA